MAAVEQNRSGVTAEQPIPCALSIAGSDCSGGAGVQADLKTFSAHGVFGMSAIVSVVAENTCRLVSVHDVPPQVIKDQVDAVFEDIPPAAVKVGMLSSAACMDAVAESLEKWRPQHVVIDPVMYAKGGAPLMAPDAVEHFKERVLGLATVLTPNIPEAEELSGVAIIDLETQVRAARVLADMMRERGGGSPAVLVKGGHAAQAAGSAASELDPDASLDVLVHDGATLGFSAPRFDTPNTHGTGCTLSSAIAANLALGEDVRDAVWRAKAYVTAAIAHALPLGHGHGPTNHFHNLGKGGESTPSSEFIYLVDIVKL